MWNGSTCLAISVGGTKVAAALLSGGRLLASSARIEWTGQGITSVSALCQLIAVQCRSLLLSAEIKADEVGPVGVAWPGPGDHGLYEATFVPGAAQRQPIA